MLRCHFTSLAARRLAGFLTVDADGATVAAAPLAMRLRDARRTLLFGPSHEPDETAAAAQETASPGAFSLFLPRRVETLFLDFFWGGEALTITLAAGLDGALRPVAEHRGDIGLLSDGYATRMLSDLYALCVSPGFFASPPPRFDAQHELLQGYYDAAFAEAPQHGVATLVDYARRYGPTPFLFEKLSLLLIRAAAHGRASTLCDAAFAAFEPTPGLHLHKAIALEEMLSLEACLPHYVAAAAGEPGNPSALLAAGRVAQRMSHGDFGASPADPAAAPQAYAYFKSALAADPTGEAAYRIGAAFAADRRYPDAEAALERAAETGFGPQAARLLAEIARVRRDRGAAERWIARLDADEANRLRAAWARIDVVEAALSADGAPTDAPDWRVDEEGDTRAARPAERRALFEAAGAAALHHAGSATALVDGAPRDFRHARFGGDRLLLERATRWRAPDAAPEIPRPTKPERRTAILVSSKGAFPFGGAERFLLGAASIYEGQGYAPRFIGFEPPETATAFAYPTDFCAPTAEAIRATAMASDPAFVHVVSGALEPVYEAFRGLDVPLVKGVHFWSEIFRAERLVESAGYGGAAMEGEDAAVLALKGAGPLYVTSRYMRAIVAARFGIAPMIAPSVEIDAPEAAPPPSGERYALLLDGRASKGGAFALELARRLPHRLFVIVCPQNALETIERRVVAERLENVAVLGRVGDIDALVAGAAALLAPSFDFVETFGRVPVEAALRGRPTIVADVGNLPELAPDPSCVLPQDAAAWAERLERFFQEPPAAIAPPPEAAPEEARRRLGRLAPTAETRVAAVLGPGESAFHGAGPALAALADHIGAPVDVIATERFDDAVDVFEIDEAVGSVIRLDVFARAKPYRTVVVFPSAWETVGSFFAERVVRLNDPPSKAFGISDEDETTRFKRVLMSALAIEAPSSEA